MKNPFGDQQIPGSYHDIKERMYRKVSGSAYHQILGILQSSYEKALHEESVVLSRAERKRLFDQIVKMLIADILKKDQ
jgi:hypothetical protein